MVLYRQPYSPAHPVTTSTFFTDFADYLETLILSSEPLVITGDFNVQVDNSNYPDATKLLDLLGWLGFCQYVTQSKHELGHTIDLTITRQSDSIIQGSPTTDHSFSDHLTVLTTLRATKPAPHQRSGCTEKLNQLIWTLFEMILHFLNCAKKPTRSLMSLLNVTIRH